MFNKRLKLLRISKNLTQKQLSLNIGVSEICVQNYESCRRKPTYDMLIIIADYFNVSLDYLTGRTDNPENKQIKSYH